MLIVENLRKEFRNVVAVDNLSFVIHPGKIFGLLGPNGAGKTTTIRTILNIIKPTSGSITIEGKPVSSGLFNILGYLPEERGLYRKSTVRDVITYMATLKGMHSTEITKGINYWLSKLVITELKERKIEELSKGNQQKVQFIISVIHNPKVLVLDEPFAGFDPINQEIIRNNILQFASEGKIIILSTHQMDTAEKLCREILLINNGKEILQGDLAVIRQSFGSNFIKLGYTGDGLFLKHNPSIRHLDCYNGHAEIQLSADVSPSEFLKDISTKTDITHFSIIEPTLNKIFIDTVKEDRTI